MTSANHSPHIGTLAEGSLHAALKAWCLRPGDQIEVGVDGYVVDILRGETAIEIQTQNFAALRVKLGRLLARRRVILVHSTPREKWIVRQAGDGQVLSRRKSPKRGRVIDVFGELVRLPHLLANPNLTVWVLLTREEEIWRDDGQGSWRRKFWSIHDRRLLEVIEQVTFASPGDYLAFLPATLPGAFTNQELAAALQCRRSLAGKITYTLRHAGLLAVEGKRGNAMVFSLPSR